MCHAPSMSVPVYSYLRLDASLQVWHGCKSVLLIWYAVCVLTVAPQLQALLLVSEAHAVVAVSVAVLTRGSVQEVHVRGAVGRSARAVLWEVTWASCTTAQRTCLFQLREQRKLGHVCILISTFVCIILYTFSSRLGYKHDRTWQIKTRVQGGEDKRVVQWTMYYNCVFACV